MKTKGFLEILTEKIMGVEKPPTYGEKLAQKLEDSGLVKLREMSPKECYHSRFISMIDHLCGECPILDETEPDYKTKVVPGVDEKKLRENYEFLKECDQNFEEVCRVMLKTKSGDLHNLTFSLCSTMQNYACYFDREHDSYEVLGETMHRYEAIALKIYKETNET